MAVLHFSSAEELEHQLSPSKWNKRMSADAVIKDHLTKTKNGNFESCVARPLVDSTGRQYRRPYCMCSLPRSDLSNSRSCTVARVLTFYLMIAPCAKTGLAAGVASYN